jgi:NADH:ubiquinone oxidoreductase subunit 5 (subunit L)/multisubunit Na+/H+ antiporter MnhA subunit
VNNVKRISQFFSAVVDVKIIDNFIVDGFGRGCKFASNKISKIQTGFIYNYFTIMFVAFLLIVGYLLLSILGFGS